MQIEETALPGVLVLTPARHGDARGFFSESWNRRTLEQAGVHLPEFVQDNHSLSARKGTLRGLQSANPAAVELMDSLAAPWRRTLFKLRFPSAVPFIAPSLRLAGASAVVGVVVAEISLGLSTGVGRLIIAYGREASTDPPKLFAAVFGAAVLGIAMSALVVAIDRLLRRNRPQEVAA